MPGTPSAAGQGKVGCTGRGTGRTQRCFCIGEGSRRVSKGGWLEGDGGLSSQGADIPPAVGVGVVGGHCHAHRPGAKSRPGGKSPAGARAAGSGCPPAPWASQGAMGWAAARSLPSTADPGCPGTHGAAELFPVPIPGGGHVMHRVAAQELGCPKMPRGWGGHDLAVHGCGALGPGCSGPHMGTWRGSPRTCGSSIHTLCPRQRLGVLWGRWGAGRPRCLLTPRGGLISPREPIPARPEGWDGRYRQPRAHRDCVGDGGRSRPPPLAPCTPLVHACCGAAPRKAEPQRHPLLLQTLLLQ